MASIIRPTIFKQACTAASTKRALSTNTSPITSAAFSVLQPSKSSSRFTKPVFINSTIPGAVRVAAFHASARRDILPPLPQKLTGTANEAAPVPTPNSIHGAYHWDFERAVSVALVPLTIAPFVGSSLNPVLDATFCALLVAHSHIGFQSCIIDYFPQKRVPKTRSALMWTLRIATLLTAVGLFEFETNDVGVTEAVKRIWKASPSTI